MLILTRKSGQSLYIGDKIVVTIVEVKGVQIRVGVDAPSEYRIFREEIYKQIQEENKQAAMSDAASVSDLDQLSSRMRGKKKDESQKGGKPRVGQLKGFNKT